jgi:hypothetical protein
MESERAVLNNTISTEDDTNNTNNANNADDASNVELF